MSMTSSNLSPSGPAGAAHRWGWFIALGVLLIVLGIFAWIEVVAVTLAGVILLGAAMLVGGVFQIIHAFAVRGWSGFLLHVLMGVLYIIGGFLIMAEPVQGAVVVTVFLAVCLAIAGIMRMVLAVQHRELTGWWLMLFSGLITLLIGLLLYAWLPWSGLWVLGTLIAVELVIQGITWVQFGLMLRRMPPRVGVTA
jgi:uncharacterized membrane protein HdeD (DUF308 family)